MTAIAFDPLAFSEDLQKAGFSREQADAMGRANATAMNNLLTAQELVTKKELEIGLSNTKHDILKWMVTAMIAQTGLLVGILAFLR